MQSYEALSRFLVRLDLDEEIITTLSQFAKEKQLKGAQVFGIGAVKQAVLGFFDLSRREYQKQEFSEEMELVSLMGNLSWSGEEPILHAHVSISGPDYRVFGGHLFSAFIAVTGEFFITPLDIKIERMLHEPTGLKLIH